MKKFCLVLMSLFLLGGMLYPIAYSQYEASQPKEEEDFNEWEFDNSPASLLNKVYRKANDDFGNKVQKTSLDNVNSRYCDELALGGNFTLARTLCSIKYLIRGYLQYIIYIGLAGATIFIIWNGFKLVTSTNKEDQMKKFKTNIIYLIVGVLLLTCFYFILDAFVSIVNFVAEG